jgi:predicted DNA-binding protein (MmcQ/YjbR family)
VHPIAELRKICLSLPGAKEVETWDQPTFRVNNKMFAISTSDTDPEHRVTVKAPPGEQRILLETGHPFFLPSYVGSKGWIGILLDDDSDWSEVAELVEDSYRLIAPKRLIAELDA